MKIFSARVGGALTVCAILTSYAAQAATVRVTVQGVRNTHGQIRVALCSRADFLRPHCSWKASAPAQNGAVVITLNAVPPGTYAAQAFHDENGNGRLDRSLLGLPKEAMAFSNAAGGRGRPPRFAAASFMVTDEGMDITLVLRY